MKALWQVQNLSKKKLYIELTEKTKVQRIIANYAFKKQLVA